VPLSQLDKICSDTPISLAISLSQDLMELLDTDNTFVKHITSLPAPGFDLSPDQRSPGVLISPKNVHRSSPDRDLGICPPPSRICSYFFFGLSRGGVFGIFEPSQVLGFL
jgi:hypothetical protein